MTCPFTGETARGGAVASGPTWRSIHAQKADRAGNVLIEGIVGVQKEAVLAAKRSLVTVEEIVDDFGAAQLNAVILPAWTITAIALVPGGAYPSYAQGYYKRDNAFYNRLGRDLRAIATASSPGCKANVLEQGPEVFAAHVRRLSSGRVTAMAELHPHRNDDRRRGARAAQRATSASSASARRRPPAIWRG